MMTTTEILMTTTEILTGIKNWVTGKLTLKQDVISDLASIRSGAQAGSTAVQPADIVSYFNDASYDSATHRINFYHGQTIKAYIDASPFIVDGMVDDVRIENGYLVIDFNTASGKQDISIPLTDIFNPNNYYTKTQTDGMLAQKQDEIQDLAAIRSGASAGATAVQPATLNSALSNTVAESGVFDLSVHNAVNGVPATYASLSAALTALNALSEAYKTGGMSFKFIHTYDNKYVQARCMAQNFTTDVTQWQGVDDEPTAGSNNLVKSGGVYDSLEKVKYISKERVSESDEEIVVKSNNEDVVKITPNYVSAKNLKSNGIPVLTEDDIAKETEVSPELEEEVIFGESESNPSLIITEEGIKVKSITDLEGNPISNDAEDINYDNTLSELNANNVQKAIDELVEKNKGIIFNAADINHIIILGQSLALGQEGAGANYANFRNSLMFSKGIAISETPIDAAELGSFVNARTPTSECPVIAMSEELLNLMHDEDNIDDFDSYGFQTLITTYGFGGQKITVLLARIEDIKTIISAAYNNAVESGKTYAVAGIGWVQGESDCNVTESGAQTYYNRLNSMFEQLNTFVKNLTGQNEDVQFITYQTASRDHHTNSNIIPYISLEQLKIGKALSNCCLGAAIYQSVYADDNIHMVTNSYRLLGANMGAALKRRIIDHKDFESIYVKEKRVYLADSKYIIELKMNVPCKPLVFDNINPVSGEAQVFHDIDSGNVVNIPFYGFEIMNSDHETYTDEYNRYAESNWNNVNIIESVSIKRGDTINIVCSNDPTGLELWYARRGNQGGGYLRDSQGDTVKITSSANSVMRVDNYCPIFMLNI